MAPEVERWRVGGLAETLSWRLVTELWRRFPDRFHLVETHPGGGQHDCLCLLGRDPGFGPRLSVNRSGGVLVHASSRHWSDWRDRLLGPGGREFLDEVTRALGLNAPASLPPSTATAVVYRFVAEFLTHSVGRREIWECRNGVLDSSGLEGTAVRRDWFTLFPAAPVAAAPPRGEAILGEPAYHYWFLLRDGEPRLCLSTDGTAYTAAGAGHNLSPLYADMRSVWAVISDVAADLLP